MNRKIAVFAMLLVVAFILGGCRFAMEEPEKKKDVMVGISLRVEDPGEPDGYTEEGDAYWLPSEEESMPMELTEEEFKALLGGGMANGMSGEYPIGEYYCYFWEKEDETGVTNGCESSWPGTMSLHNIYTDTGEEHKIDAAVYINAESIGDFTSFHIDPIYRRADGTLYASHDIAGVSGHIDGFSQTVSEETSVTNVDGETETYKFTFAVRYEQAPEAQAVQVIAFDAQHNMLAVQAVAPEKDEYGAYRCAYTAPENAAYVLLEEILSDGNVKRTAADIGLANNGDVLFTFYVTDEGCFAYPCDVFLAKE